MMPALLPANTWDADPTLRFLLGAWLRPETLNALEPAFRQMGRAAAGELQAWGDACEGHPAFLRSFDGWGERVDEVVYPDAWRRLAGAGGQAGVGAVAHDGLVRVWGGGR